MGSHRSVVDWTKQRSRTTSGVRVVWDTAGGHSVSCNGNEKFCEYVYCDFCVRSQKCIDITSVGWVQGSSSVLYSSYFRA